MESEQIAHLAGVFDAVGTLTVHVAPRSSYSVGYEYRPLLRLNRGKQHTTLIGKLDAYANEQGVTPSIEETDSSYEFEVYGPDAIEAFLEPMMPYLVTAYEPAYIMVNNIIPNMRDDRHLTEAGFYEMMGYADRLRETRAHGPDAKYTQDYFESEFGDAVSAKN